MLWSHCWPVYLRKGAEGYGETPKERQLLLRSSRDARGIEEQRGRERERERERDGD